jgi:hypothetical protein
MNCPVCQKLMQYVSSSPPDPETDHHECVTDTDDHFVMNYDDGIWWIELPPHNIEVARFINGITGIHECHIRKLNAQESSDLISAINFEDAYEYLKKYIKLRIFS